MFAQQRRDQGTPIRMKPMRDESACCGKDTHGRNPVWQSLAMRSVGIQAKLAVSQPGDQHEREADRIADAVIHGQAVDVHHAAAPSSTVRRTCGGCKGEQEGHKCAECEGEQQSQQQEETPVQAKRDAGAAEPAGVAGGHPDTFEGRGHPLPSALRGEFEPRFGHDLSHVRLHTDAAAGESASAFNALAFTYGRNVVFGAGQFNPTSTTGRHLIAHELAHVVQQSGQAQPSIQRQFDPCIIVSGRKLCGQDAADACKKVALPGCSFVCKLFDCSKPKVPTTRCPTGWNATLAKGFEDQCCLGSSVNAQNCCTPDRIALLDNRCCKEGEVVVNNRCKTGDVPSIPFCPPGQSTVSGECCVSPKVSNGLECVLPTVPIPTKPPVTPPTPQPALPTVIDIFFKKDRPKTGETGSALTSATTADGKAHFDALVKSLKADPGLKTQLVGRASPEGDDDYNLELGARRAKMVAEALKSAGIPESQIADPPVADLRAECKPLTPGLVTCGEAGATGDGDREVMARVFQSTP
jgi:Domain of unknown function (DUF4157)